MNKKEHIATKELIANIPKNMMNELDEALECQGITLDEAVNSMVASYLRLFHEVMGKDAAGYDPIVQELMRGMLPDGKVHTQGQIFHLKKNRQSDTK